MLQNNYPWFPEPQLLVKPNRCFIITKAKSYAMSQLSQQVAKKYLQTNDLTDHLDYLVIDTKGKASVSVDTVKTVLARTYLTSRSNAGKVLIVEDADKLTISASNAMLKVLEEPPQGLLTMLLCENQESLKSTLRSRCEIIAPLQLDHSTVTQWLNDLGYDSDQVALCMLLSYHKPMVALEKLESGALTDFREKSTQLLSVLNNQLSIANYSKKFINNREALLAELELILLVLISALRQQNTQQHTFSKYEVMNKLVECFVRIPAHLISDLLQWVCKLNTELHIITGLRSDWAALQLQIKIAKISQ